MDHDDVIYVPNMLSSDLVLCVTDMYCRAYLQALKSHQQLMEEANDDTGGAAAGSSSAAAVTRRYMNSEIEIRAGKINGNNNNNSFEAGVEKKMFDQMLGYLQGKAKSGSWYQVDFENIGPELTMDTQKKVEYTYTDVIDISIEGANIGDDYRVAVDTKSIAERNPRVVEVIKKSSNEKRKDFKMKNAEKQVQNFDLRASLSTETVIDYQDPVVQPLSNFVAESLFSGKRNDSILKNVDILTGCALKIELNPMQHRVVLKETNFYSSVPIRIVDPVRESIPLVNGEREIPEEIYSKLEWTLLCPATLSQLEHRGDLKFHSYTFPNGEVLVEVGNLPGRLTLNIDKNEVTFSCSAYQYVILVPVSALKPAMASRTLIGPLSTNATAGKGRKGGRYNDDDGDQMDNAAQSSLSRSDPMSDYGFVALYYRRKRRHSFHLGHGLKLDMTSSQASDDYSLLSMRPILQELEMELMVTPEDIYEEGSEYHIITKKVITLLALVSKNYFGFNLPPMDKNEFQKLVGRAQDYMNSIQSGTKISTSMLPSSKKRERVMSMESDSGLRSSKSSKHDHISDQELTRKAYDELKRDEGERTQSLIFHMRCLNNFIKSVAIRKGMEKLQVNDISILDLACGKGADMKKFVHSLNDLGTKSIKSYVGVDIAQRSLVDSTERMKMGTAFPFPIKLIAADLGKHPLSSNVSKYAVDEDLDVWVREHQWRQMKASSILSPAEKFDMVSMQFAFHYMFQTEERANHFFYTLSSLMAPNARFVATTVNANAMVQKLMNSDASNDCEVLLKDEKNRVICKIEFDEDTRDRLLNPGKLRRSSHDFIKNNGDIDDGYGLRYQFSLFDTNDSSSESEDKAKHAVNAPEYLVPLPVVQSLAFSYNLELEESIGFHEFVETNIKGNEDLWRKMYVPNINRTLSAVEWDIAGLYSVFTFRKRTSEKDFTLEAMQARYKQHYPLLDIKAKNELITREYMKKE